MWVDDFRKDNTNEDALLKGFLDYVKNFNLDDVKFMWFYELSINETDYILNNGRRAYWKNN